MESHWIQPMRGPVQGVGGGGILYWNLPRLVRMDLTTAVLLLVLRRGSRELRIRSRVSWINRDSNLISGTFNKCYDKNRSLIKEYNKEIKVVYSLEKLHFCITFINDLGYGYAFIKIRLFRFCVGFRIRIRFIKDLEHGIRFYLG